MTHIRVRPIADHEPSDTLRYVVFGALIVGVLATLVGFYVLLAAS